MTIELSVANCLPFATAFSGLDTSIVEKFRRPVDKLRTSRNSRIAEKEASFASPHSMFHA